MRDESPNHDPAAPGADPRWLAALAQGLPILASVRSAGLGAPVDTRADTLLALSHLLLFRMRTRNPFPLIGILGNADSGKSTLLGSVAGREVSRVTPIPHQTTGPILSVPRTFSDAAADPSFLRPVVDRLDWMPEDTTGLSGSPQRAVAVPCWDAAERPFLLMDLPDFGTVDSLEEHQVALRMLPWLDRVILLVTEETFAQGEHEELMQALDIVRPDRARGELFVVLNRRHAVTTDPEFNDRLAAIRRLWPQATVSTLPHLHGERFFPAQDAAPLISECHLRVVRILQAAVRNLADDLGVEVRAAGEQRAAEDRLLRDALRRDVRAGRDFNKSFFSNDFRQRLEAFSPWNVSVKRVRSLLRNERSRAPSVVDLLAEAPVQRQVLETAQRMRQRVLRHRERLAHHPPDPSHAPPAEPAFDAQAVQAAVSDLVTRINRQARSEVESLLASLQEDRKIKDPLWGLMAGVSSTLLLLELVIPGFGTLSSMTFSGLLSALGFGGILTADMMRKLRSNRLRETFESGMDRILEEVAEALLPSGGPLSVRELHERSRRLAAWSRGLPEVG